MANRRVKLEKGISSMIAGKRERYRRWKEHDSLLLQQRSGLIERQLAILEDALAQLQAQASPTKVLQTLRDADVQLYREIQQAARAED